MHTLVEITKYPLDADYETPVLDFIARMRKHPGLDISVGETSTVIRGSYDQIMMLLTKEMKTSLDSRGRTAFVLKILNTE